MQAITRWVVHHDGYYLTVYGMLGQFQEAEIYHSQKAARLDLLYALEAYGLPESAADETEYHPIIVAKWPWKQAITRWVVRHKQYFLTDSGLFGLFEEARVFDNPTLAKNSLESACEAYGVDGCRIYEEASVQTVIVSPWPWCINRPIMVC